MKRTQFILVAGLILIMGMIVASQDVDSYNTDFQSVTNLEFQTKDSAIYDPNLVSNSVTVSENDQRIKEINTQSVKFDYDQKQKIDLQDVKKPGEDVKKSVSVQENQQGGSVSTKNNESGENKSVSVKKDETQSGKKDNSSGSSSSSSSSVSVKKDAPSESGSNNQSEEASQKPSGEEQQKQPVEEAKKKSDDDSQNKGKKQTVIQQIRDRIQEIKQNPPQGLNSEEKKELLRKIDEVESVKKQTKKKQEELQDKLEDFIQAHIKQAKSNLEKSQNQDDKKKIEERIQHLNRKLSRVHDNNFNVLEELQKDQDDLKKIEGPKDPKDEGSVKFEDDDQKKGNSVTFQSSDDQKGKKQGKPKQAAEGEGAAKSVTFDDEDSSDTKSVQFEDSVIPTKQEIAEIRRQIVELRTQSEQISKQIEALQTKARQGCKSLSLRGDREQREKSYQGAVEQRAKVRERLREQLKQFYDQLINSSGNESEKEKLKKKRALLEDKDFNEFDQQWAIEDQESSKAAQSVKFEGDGNSVGFEEDKDSSKSVGFEQEKGKSVGFEQDKGKSVQLEDNQQGNSVNLQADNNNSGKKSSVNLQASDNKAGSGQPSVNLIKNSDQISANFQDNNGELSVGWEDNDTKSSVSVSLLVQTRSQEDAPGSVQFESNNDTSSVRFEDSDSQEDESKLSNKQLIQYLQKQLAEIDQKLSELKKQLSEDDIGGECQILQEERKKLKDALVEYFDDLAKRAAEQQKRQEDGKREESLIKQTQKTKQIAQVKSKQAAAFGPQEAIENDEDLKVLDTLKLDQNDGPDDGKSGSIQFQDKPDDPQKAGSVKFQNKPDDPQKAGSVKFENKPEDTEKSGSVKFQDKPKPQQVQKEEKQEEQGSVKFQDQKEQPKEEPPKKQPQEETQKQEEKVEQPKKTQEVKKVQEPVQNPNEIGSIQFEDKPRIETPYDVGSIKFEDKPEDPRQTGSINFDDQFDEGFDDEEIDEEDDDARADVEKQHILQKNAFLQFIGEIRATIQDAKQQSRDASAAGNSQAVQIQNNRIQTHTVKLKTILKRYYDFEIQYHSRRVEKLQTLRNNLIEKQASKEKIVKIQGEIEFHLRELQEVRDFRRRLELPKYRTFDVDQVYDCQDQEELVSQHRRNKNDILNKLRELKREVKEAKKAYSSLDANQPSASSSQSQEGEQQQSNSNGQSGGEEEGNEESQKKQNEEQQRQQAQREKENKLARDIENLNKNLRDLLDEQAKYERGYHSKKLTKARFRAAQYAQQQEQAQSEQRQVSNDLEKGIAEAAQEIQYHQRKLALLKESEDLLANPQYESPEEDQDFDCQGDELTQSEHTLRQASFQETFKAFHRAIKDSRRKIKGFQQKNSADLASAEKENLGALIDRLRSTLAVFYQYENKYHFRQWKRARLVLRELEDQRRKLQNEENKEIPNDLARKLQIARRTVGKHAVNLDDVAKFIAKLADQSYTRFDEEFFDCQAQDDDEDLNLIDDDDDSLDEGEEDSDDEDEPHSHGVQNNPHNKNRKKYMDRLVWLRSKINEAQSNADDTQSGATQEARRQFAQQVVKYRVRLFDVTQKHLNYEIKWHSRKVLRLRALLEQRREQVLKLGDRANSQLKRKIVNLERSLASHLEKLSYARDLLKTVSEIKDAQRRPIENQLDIFDCQGFTYTDQEHRINKLINKDHIDNLKKAIGQAKRRVLKAQRKGDSASQETQRKLVENQETQLKDTINSIYAYESTYHRKKVSALQQQLESVKTDLQGLRNLQNKQEDDQATIQERADNVRALEQRVDNLSKDIANHQRIVQDIEEAKDTLNQAEPEAMLREPLYDCQAEDQTDEKRHREQREAQKKIVRVIRDQLEDALDELDEATKNAKDTEQGQRAQQRALDAYLDASDELRDALKEFYDEEIRYHSQRAARIREQIDNSDKNGDKQKSEIQQLRDQLQNHERILDDLTDIRKQLDNRKKRAFQTEEIYDCFADMLTDDIHQVKKGKINAEYKALTAQIRDSLNKIKVFQEQKNYQAKADENETLKCARNDLRQVIRRFYVYERRYHEKQLREAQQYLDALTKKQREQQSDNSGEQQKTSADDLSLQLKFARRQVQKQNDIISDIAVEHRKINDNQYTTFDTDEIYDCEADNDLKEHRQAKKDLVAQIDQAQKQVESTQKQLDAETKDGETQTALEEQLQKDQEALIDLLKQYYDLQVQFHQKRVDERKDDLSAVKDQLKKADSQAAQKALRKQVRSARRELGKHRKILEIVKEIRDSLENGSYNTQDDLFDCDLPVQGIEQDDDDQNEDNLDSDGEARQQEEDESDTEEGRLNRLKKHVANQNRILAKLRELKAELAQAQKGRVTAIKRAIRDIYEDHLNKEIAYHSKRVEKTQQKLNQLKASDQRNQDTAILYDFLNEELANHQRILNEAQEIQQQFASGQKGYDFLKDPFFDCENVREPEIDEKAVIQQLRETIRATKAQIAQLNQARQTKERTQSEDSSQASAQEIQQIKKSIQLQQDILGAARRKLRRILKIRIDRQVYYYNQTITDLEKKQNELEEKLKGEQDPAVINKLEKQLQIVKDKIIELKAQVKRLRNKREKLDDEEFYIDQEDDQDDEDDDETGVDSDSDKDDAENPEGKHIRKMRKLRNRRTSVLEDLINRKKQLVDQLKERLAQLKEKLQQGGDKSVEPDIDDLTRRIAELEGDIQQHKKDLEQLQEDQAEDQEFFKNAKPRQEKQQAIASDLAKLMQETNDLQKKLAELQQQLEEAKSDEEKTDLQEQVASLEQQIQDNKQRIENLKNLLKRIDDDEEIQNYERKLRDGRRIKKAIYDDEIIENEETIEKLKLELETVKQLLKQTIQEQEVESSKQDSEKDSSAAQSLAHKKVTYQRRMVRILQKIQDLITRNAVLRLEKKILDLYDQQERRRTFRANKQHEVDTLIRNVQTEISGLEQDLLDIDEVVQRQQDAGQQEQARQSLLGKINNINLKLVHRKNILSGLQLLRDRIDFQEEQFMQRKLAKEPKLRRLQSSIAKLEEEWAAQDDRWQRLEEELAGIAIEDERRAEAVKATDKVIEGVRLLREKIAVQREERKIIIFTEEHAQYRGHRQILIYELQHRIRVLQTQNEQSHTLILDLEERLRNTPDVEDSAAVKNQLTSQINELKAQIQDNKKTIDNLTVQLQKLLDEQEDEEQIRIRRRIQEIVQKQAQTRSIIEQLVKEKAQLQATLSQGNLSKEEQDQINARIVEIDAQIKELLGQIDKDQIEQKDLQKQLKEYRQQELDRAIRQKRAEIEEMLRKAEQSGDQEAIKKIKEQIEAENKVLQDLREQRRLLDDEEMKKDRETQVQPPVDRETRKKQLDQLIQEAEDSLSQLRKLKSDLQEKLKSIPQGSPDREGLLTEIRQVDEKIKQLQEKISQFRKQRKSIDQEERLERELAERNRLKKQLDDEILQAERQLAELEKELSELDRQFILAKPEDEKEIAELKKKIHQTKSQIQELRERIADLRRRRQALEQDGDQTAVQETQSDSKEQEKQELDLQISILEQRIEAAENELADLQTRFNYSQTPKPQLDRLAVRIEEIRKDLQEMRKQLKTLRKLRKRLDYEEDRDISDDDADVSGQCRRRVWSKNQKINDILSFDPRTLKDPQCAEEDEFKYWEFYYRVWLAFFKDPDFVLGDLNVLTAVRKLMIFTREKIIDVQSANFAEMMNQMKRKTGHTNYVQILWGQQIDLVMKYAQVAEDDPTSDKLALVEQIIYMIDLVIQDIQSALAEQDIFQLYRDYLQIQLHNLLQYQSACGYIDQKDIDVFFQMTFTLPAAQDTPQDKLITDTLKVDPNLNQGQIINQIQLSLIQVTIAASEGNQISKEHSDKQISVFLQNIFLQTSEQQESGFVGEQERQSSSSTTSSTNKLAAQTPQNAQTRSKQSNLRRNQ